MSFYPVFPEELAGAEFVLVRFDLEMISPCELGLMELLGLRPLLHGAAGGLSPDCRKALFEPPLSSDPQAVRRYQKPSPPFVLRPAPELAGRYQEGDVLALEVLFLGAGIQTSGDFLAVLRALGERGLQKGGGRFEVLQAKTLGADGKWRVSWRNGRSSAAPALELVRLDQWLDQSWPADSSITLTLTTPARLVAGGRVLRRPLFRQIFPFMLRRVTSMLHAHCAIEPVDEPALLLELAASVEWGWLEARWLDWHDGGSFDELAVFGGCTGRLRLAGAGLEPLLWIVLLATLFGFGRGASYGSGACRVESTLVL